MKSLLLLCAVVLHCVCAHEMRLEKLASLQIPFRRSPNEFSLFKNLVDVGSYDRANNMFYVTGKGDKDENSYVDVIDISNPSDPRIVYTETFTKNQLGLSGATAVQVCGNLVAVTRPAFNYGDRGVVRLYRPFSYQSRSMQFVREISVGHSPDALQFTRNCDVLFVLNEGLAGRDKQGRFVDPEGTITKISNLQGFVPPLVQTIDFRQFNNEASVKEFLRQGGRKVWNGQNSPLLSTTLSQDLEPEEAALSDDERTLYITLQENNAIARIDVASGRVISLNGLGFKEFNGTLGLDPSDIAPQKYLEPYPVQGIYNPDPIKFITLGNQGYLITGNEGNIKHYNREDHGFDWEERVRVSSNLDLFDKNSFDEETLKQMQNNKLLGRLFVSSVDPVDCEGRIKRLRAFGGRSFSVHRASDLERIFDSGSQLAEQTLENLYPVFNMIPQGERDAMLAPNQLDDVASPFRGGEVNGLATGVIGSQQLLFVGIQNTGAIFMYSFPRSVPIPLYEGIHREGSLDEGLQFQYISNRVGDLGISGLHFIPATENVSGKNLLVVTAEYSGTVSLYEVKDIPDSVPK